MKITYNAPVVLTLTLICTIITSFDTIFTTTLMSGKTTGAVSQNFFTVYPFSSPYMSLSDPLTYWRLFSHALGHSGWGHLIGNFSFILLLGPVLEEKYGAKSLIMMMFITALITGILNATFFPNGLLGASGIVFMMILLVSFTNATRGTIPLTFLLVATLYLGGEIYNAVGGSEKNISQFAHIIGGLFGGVFGYMMNNLPNKKAPNSDIKI